MKTANYYVYVWSDTRYPCKLEYLGYIFKYLPFYIGKGHGRRYKALWGRNSHFQNKYAKIKCETGWPPKVTKVSTDLEEEEAFALEMALIEAMGRRNLKTGPLVNYTNGGEGNSGIETSEEVKRKISKKLKGLFAGTKHPMFGKNHSKETRLKMSKSLSKEKNPFYGKHHSDQAKKKISRAQIGKQNGDKNPMFGKTHSAEARNKISKAHKGRKLSEERKQQISMFFKGTQQSPEHIAKKIASYKATIKATRIEKNKTYRAIWKKIETLMLAKNITQVELSEKSGVNLPNISSMKHGKRGIGIKTLRKFSVVLGDIDAAECS